MLHHHRIELLVAGFIIDDDAPGRIRILGGTKVHAVNPALEQQPLAAGQRNLPGGIRMIVKRQLNLDGIETVLFAHPFDECFYEALQRGCENPGQETALVAGLKQARAIAGKQAVGNPRDALPGIRGGDVAPTFLFAPQFLVEQSENVVLEVSLLFGVQFKDFSLLGAEARIDEELERTSGELFHAADGGLQDRAV